MYILYIDWIGFDSISIWTNYVNIIVMFFISLLHSNRFLIYFQQTLRANILFTLLFSFYPLYFVHIYNTQSFPIRYSQSYFVTFHPKIDFENFWLKLQIFFSKVNFRSTLVPIEWGIGFLNKLWLWNRFFRVPFYL